MIRNYITTALRNIFRHKLDSFLNVSGLVIGMTAALLIALFVRGELGYDSQWTDAERLYRVQTTWVMDQRENIELVVSSGPVKPALESYFADELEVVARLNYGTDTVRTASEQFTDVISFADPGILDIFDLEILAGDARAALASTSTIILSEALAKKYFGDQDPLGQTLFLQDMESDYVVTAIMRDLPSNTHLVIDALIAIEEDNPGVGGRFNSWNEANNHIYIKLAPGAEINSINARMPNFVDIFIPASQGREKASETNILTNQAVLGIHLDGEGAGSRKAGGDRNVVMAFAIIAALIIAVAAINFINLSTARASRRAREVALRKAMGATRGQLIVQHMGEAFLVVGFASLVAYLAGQTVLPFLNAVLGKDMVLTMADPVLRNIILSSIIIVAVISGIYPSLILSSFRPSHNLKASGSTETKGTATARSTLVVFQSAVTIALIVATSVVFAQLAYFGAVDRGFDPDNLLVIDGLGEEATRDSNKTFKDEVLRLRGVEAASLVIEPPTSFFEQNMRLYSPEHLGEQGLVLGRTRIDPDYFDTMKIPFLAGRQYEVDRAMDMIPDLDAAVDGDVLEANIIMNAAAAEALGLGSPDEAVGQQIFFRFGTDDDGTVVVNLNVIGIVGDHQVHSIKIKPRPEVYLNQDRYFSLVMRLSGDPAEVLPAVEALWRDMYPDEVFRHFFVEDALAEEYQVEQGQMNLFLAFAILTIVIGCLGLYGLAAFVAERRRQEIGIRKVLGAEVSDIINLLIWQFSKPVLLANLLAWPVAGYFMLGWLSQYPNRLDGAWIGLFCLTAGLAALLVAWAAVGTQAWRVARTNPILALRYE